MGGTFFCCCCFCLFKPVFRTFLINFLSFASFFSFKPTTDNQCIPGSLLEAVANKQMIDFPLNDDFRFCLCGYLLQEIDFIVYIKYIAILELHTLKINMKLILLLLMEKVQSTT